MNQSSPQEKQKPSNTHDKIEKKQSVQSENQEQKIMTKAEQINYLILQKGFVKVKVTSHISVPAHKNSKEAKTTVLLVPPLYTVYKLKQQIKKSFNVRQSQAIFIFVKSQKIVDSSITVKQMYERFVGHSNNVTQCLELSVYSSQFS